MKSVISKAIESHQEALEYLENNLQDDLLVASDLIVKALKRGNKILLCGNGGSASDAQHISAEFTGRFVKERVGLPAIALTTDTSALTAIGNDYGFDRVFERQVEALANDGDILIGISTSGNSTNVLRALERANALGCLTIGFSGRDGGDMSELCDINLVVSVNETARIQEMHILIGHILCAIVDEKVS